MLKFVLTGKRSCVVKLMNVTTTITTATTPARVPGLRAMGYGLRAVVLLLPSQPSAITSPTNPELLAAYLHMIDTLIIDAYVCAYVHARY